jgi:predicted nucleic acid-binding protein
MKYIDSCVFIGAYFPDDPNHKVSIEFIEKLNKGEFTGVISIFWFK